MDKDDHLQRHLDLCRRMYLRMLADGTWPWKDDEIEAKSDAKSSRKEGAEHDADSQKSQGLIDSADNPKFL